jgi:hypothetical protein
LSRLSSPSAFDHQLLVESAMLTPLDTICRSAIALLCAGALASCVGGGAGNGGGALPCALDGTCPAGSTCIGQSCIPVADTAAADIADAGSSSGAASSGASSSGASSSGASSSSSGGEDAGSSSSSGSEDAGGSSSGSTSSSSGGEDASSSSSGTQDTNGGANVVKIAVVQAASDSTTCAKKDGQTKVLEGAKIEDCIATHGPFKAGGSWIFHARPASAPQVGGANQGIKVFVHSGEPKVKAGDLLSITGDIVEYYCESEITAAAKDVKVVSSGTPPAPYEVKPSSITFNGDSEKFEGVLVKLINVKVEEANYNGNDGKTHGGFSVVGQTNSSSVVHVDLASASSYTANDATSKQLKTTLTAGQVISSITGHLDYSFGEYVLIPRDDADLVTQ